MRPKNNKLIKIIIKNINIKNNFGSTGLFKACQEGHIDIVKLLIENNADINAIDYQGATGFYMACQEGHYKIVKHLIYKGVDITQVSSKGHTGLSFACAKNHTDIIELLTDKLNRVCIVCDKVSRNRCKNCDTRYCSSECQLIDWKKHKLICKKINK